VIFVVNFSCGELQFCKLAALFWVYCVICYMLRLSCIPAETELKYSQTRRVLSLQPDCVNCYAEAAMLTDYSMVHTV
jgi:hypothetical protein